MHNYDYLIRSIVKLAVEDYRDGLIKTPSKYQHMHTGKPTAEEAEKFLLSDWFFELSGLNGAYIIEKVRKELNK